MSLIIDGSNGLTFPNSTTQASAGNVLQVVNTIYGTDQSIASGASYASTGLSASITPKFSTSKILILVQQMVYVNTSAYGFGLAIYKNGSSVYTDTNAYDSGYINNTGVITSFRNSRVGIQYLDSPATTSSTTYTVYATSYTANIYFQNSGAKSMITLMEIAQ